MSEPDNERKGLSRKHRFQIAAAVILPATRKEWPLLLTYRPPRTTVLLPLSSTSPEGAALAVQSGAAADISVGVVDAGKRRSDHAVQRQKQPEVPNPMPKQG